MSKNIATLKSIRDIKVKVNSATPRRDICVGAYNISRSLAVEPVGG